MCYLCRSKRQKTKMNTIKEYLNYIGITQKELAERLGVTQATVSVTISRPSFPTLRPGCGTIATSRASFGRWGTEASQGATWHRWRWRLGGCCACRLWDIHRRQRATAPNNRGEAEARRKIRKSKSRQVGTCRDKMKRNERAQPYTSRSPRKSAPKRCSPSSIFCNCTSEI